MLDAPSRGQCHARHAPAMQSGILACLSCRLDTEPAHRTPGEHVMNHLQSCLARATFAAAIAITSAGAWAGEQQANATVSFGQWMSAPPLDRFPNFGGSPTTNVH